MIARVGIDLIEVARIRRAMRRAGFVDRVLTAGERQHCREAGQVAGRWAVKEAVKKCVPTVSSWHDVEVRPGPGGEPVATLRPGLLEPGQRMHVSLSHERGHAVAVAILESA